MKQVLKDVLSIVLTVTVSLVATSCLDSNKDLFDKEKTKEMYESSFPVQNVDPSMDWKTTQTAHVSISVNEDWGTDYKIEIFTANPLSKPHNAKLLTEGYANQDMKFETTMDYPSALSTVFVARVDTKGRYIIKPVDVENGRITASFGTNNKIVSRATTRSNFTITTHEAPYTEQEINEKLNTATEIQSGWDLGAMKNWDSNKYGKYDVFDTPNGQPRFFKITTPATDILNASGSAILKIIVTSKLNLTRNPSMSGSIELIVANGGEVAISTELQLTQSSNITVLPGGKITGKGTLRLTNAASQKINYNSGTIDLIKISMNEGNGLLYNNGTLTVDNLDITNTTTKLINLGKATIGITNTQTTIENGCNLSVDDFNGILRLGESSAAVLNKYNEKRGDNPDLTLGKNSMLTINKAYLTEENVHGPSDGYTLVKIKKIEQLNNFQSSGNIYYEIAEFDNNISTDSWMDRFYNALKNSEGTISKFGESPIIIPAGECTGEGNTPNDTGENVEVNPMNYAYAFEDNFPYPGDYDFNDIVLDVSTEYIKDNGTNKINKIQYNVTLRAVGGTKKLGAGLRLAGISPSTIASIDFEGRTAMRETLTNSMFETGAIENNNKNEVVIPLFGDAHQVYGVTGLRKQLNTGQDPLNEIYTLKVIITLTDQSKTTPAITKENLDFFIAYGLQGRSARTEVHLYEFRNYGATANGDVHQVNLDLAENRTWAISVPDFKYPTEGTNIIHAYPEFELWAQSHTSYTEWYKHPTEKTDKKYIFEGNGIK